MAQDKLKARFQEASELNAILTTLVHNTKRKTQSSPA